GSHRPAWATPFTFKRTVTMSATRDSDRPGEGALREHSSEMTPIVGRGVDIRVGIDQLGRPTRRRLDRRFAEPLALQNLLGGAQPHGHGPGPGGGQARQRAALAVAHDDRRDTDDREITVSARELFERVA